LQIQEREECLSKSKIWFQFWSTCKFCNWILWFGTFVAISWAFLLPSWMQIFMPQHLTRRVNPSKSKQKNKTSPSKYTHLLVLFQNWLHFLFWCCFAHKCPLSWVLESYNLAMVKEVANFCPSTSSSITSIFLIFLELNCKTFFPNLHISNLSQTSIDCKKKIVVRFCSTSCIRSHCVCFC
jgi:hypothetical protein